ncbi:ABC transporter permease [Gottschalkia acidurici]|nr:ABC transporter permease subunit [Gottschalkia acidurici]
MSLTKEELLEMESLPKTKLDVMKDYLICFLPVTIGILCLLEYYFIPNYGMNTITNVYGGFIGILITVFFIMFLISLKNKLVFEKLRYKAPFYSAVFMLLTGYDVLTLKTGTLMLPYFPWTDRILNAMISDWRYLLDCVKNSLILLFTGYFSGAIIGLITGISCGYSKKVNYWISPFMRLLGPIPSITWLPIVIVIMTSLFNGAVVIIALGVWYSVSMATITGISNVDASYFEVAKTLGAGSKELVFGIAIPHAMPNIFQGLTQGMSSACTALLIAEMVGVESGLGWYINWQKSWAEFGKMYGAVILICLTFITVNFILSRIKKYVLRWQEGVIQ